MEHFQFFSYSTYTAVSCQNTAICTSPNPWKLSCLKAKTYHRKSIPSACIFMSFSCNLTQTPLLFHLSTEALLPTRSGCLQIFQAGICSAALPSFNSQAGNQVGIISSSTQPPSSCSTLLFLQHITTFKIHLFCDATLPTDCCLYGLYASFLHTHVLW